jgi:hypothetical protein
MREVTRAFARTGEEKAPARERAGAIAVVRSFRRRRRRS